MLKGFSHLGKPGVGRESILVIANFTFLGLFYAREFRLGHTCFPAVGEFDFIGQYMS